MKLKIAGLIILSSVLSYAINCSLIKDVKKWHGHYYTITTKRITFLEAKQFAENSGGYLAIPNNKAENDFLKSLIPSPKYAWIGVYDPQYTSNYCYEGDDNCAYDDSRFVDIKGNPLTYTNWADNQPDNLVKSYDIYNGKQMVSPLGEHWVAMASTNGKWADFGNHYNEYNNPVKHFALIEFDKQPECYTPDSNVTDTFKGAKCNTKIYDKTTGKVKPGKTYNCLKDPKGNYYCPAGLAPCGQTWSYKDGYAVTHTGDVKDYAGKACDEGKYNPSINQCEVFGKFGYKTGKAKKMISDWLIPYHKGRPISNYDDFRFGETSARKLCQGEGGGEFRYYSDLDKKSEITRWDGVEEYEQIYSGNKSLYARHNGNWISWSGRGTFGKKCSGEGNCIFKVKCYISECDKYYNILPKYKGRFVIPKGDYYSKPDKVCQDFGYDYAAKAYYGTLKNNVKVAYKLNGKWIFTTTPFKSDGGDWQSNKYFSKIICVEKGQCPTGVINGQSFKYKTCQEGYLLTENNKCVKYLPSKCPKNYKPDNSGNCVRDLTYTYYQYLCSGKNEYNQKYEPINPGYSHYKKTDPDLQNPNPDLANSVNSSTPPKNNCKAKSFVCKPAPDRKCVLVDNKWQCSPYPCFGKGEGDYNIINDDTPTGINDANNNGWNADGTCSGQIYIFNGKDMRCRSDDVAFGLTGGGCCNKDKVFMGLIQCKEDEIILSKKRENGECHYIGTYCSQKLDLKVGKICIQHKKTYCCFNSKLARIINEQGRPQLDKDWGSPKEPNCRGFTPDEFQKLDFSKMDLSEFYKDLSQNISKNVLKNMTHYIKQSIKSQVDNSK
jgi:hypothetical protein